MRLSDRYQRIAALSDPAEILRAAIVIRRRDDQGLQTPFVPPATSDEQVLASLWTAVLSLDRVGVEDNFFELGGDSLQLTQILARMRGTFGRGLEADAFFEAPTIRGMAEALARPPEPEADLASSDDFDDWLTAGRPDGD